MTASALDTVLQVLADRRRRVVLSVLRTAGSRVALSDLAAQVAGLEADRAPESISERRRSDVAASLHHTHLPKFERAGWLRYDAARRRIEHVDRDRLDLALDEAARAVTALAVPRARDASRRAAGDGDRHLPPPSGDNC